MASDNPPIPFITTEQMRGVDRVMVQDYYIQLVQFMENAGRHLEHLARWRFLVGDSFDKRVIVLAGTGGKRWSVGSSAAFE